MPGLRRLAACLVLASALPLWANLSSESGEIVSQNYLPKAYGASPQNWAVVQDSRGIMYFGNTAGVLEFDGVFWRLIPLTNGSAARSLAIDTSGRVYVGGQGTFGYLAPDEHGLMRFVPVAVPKADSGFADVWNVIPTSSGVYFSSNLKLFLLMANGAVKVWRASKAFGRAFSLADELFITTLDHGMLRLEGNSFVSGPTGDVSLVHGRVVFGPGRRPLVATIHALFQFALTNIDPFSNAAESYLREHGIYCLKQLPNDEILVGTANGGLVLLSKDGSLERIIRKEDGLASDWVSSIETDHSGGIWVTTDNGISRFDPKLSAFGERQGVNGGVISVSRLGGVMYAGSTRGLFRMRTAPGAAAIFDPIPSLADQVFVLAEGGGAAFAGAQHGLYQVLPSGVRQILATDIVYDIGFSPRDPLIVYTAGRDGIRVFRRSDKGWDVIAHESSQGLELRTVAEDRDGRVWATSLGAVWRFDFRLSPVKAEKFATAEGVPKGWTNVYLVAGRVMFASPKGLLTFFEQTRRFLPDLQLGEQFADGNKGVSVVRNEAKGNLWVTGEGYHGVLQRTPDGEFRWRSMPLLRTGIGELWSFFLDQDGVCWASGSSGTLFRQEKPLAASGGELSVLLRRVAVNGREVPLYGGSGESGSLPVLAHRDNALRFEFAAPFYDDPTSLEYQVLLEGNEKQWSPWTGEPRKDYTNLFEHKYRFHVRARNSYGSVSPEAVFSFQVAPPFARTWWAYISYVALFLFAGWLILRWRLDALKARNRWLEGVVTERTAEVRRERDQNEALLLNILPKPVASELREQGKVKPSTFEDVTVCFSDFVGFTLSSEKLPAEKLITSLNEYFTAFDEIIGRYGLEKLKTIGDAYMFAAGLPNTSASHAVDAVMAALEMVCVVDRLSHPDEGVNWKIRLGLYSGPVVAGVVGVRKFAFDIWGNTVNFAARMESAGSPGRVNLSETTYAKVAPFIDCEARGAVPIKEGRRMNMYFAVAPKDDFHERYVKAFGEPPRAFPEPQTLAELKQRAEAQ